MHAWEAVGCSNFFGHVYSSKRRRCHGILGFSERRKLDTPEITRHLKSLVSSISDYLDCKSVFALVAIDTSGFRPFLHTVIIS